MNINKFIFFMCGFIVFTVSCKKSDGDSSSGTNKANSTELEKKMGSDHFCLDVMGQRTVCPEKVNAKEVCQSLPERAKTPKNIFRKGGEIDLTELHTRSLADDCSALNLYEEIERSTKIMADSARLSLGFLEKRIKRSPAEEMPALQDERDKLLQELKKMTEEGEVYRARQGKATANIEKTMKTNYGVVWSVEETSPQPQNK